MRTVGKKIFLYCFIALIFFSAVIYSVLHGYTKKVACVLVSKEIQIDKPGCYRLTKDIKATEESLAPIMVKANNVSIDLNHKTIFGNKDKKKNNFGVFIANVNNIKVSNGGLKNFYDSILISSSKRVAIKKVKAQLVKNIGILISNSEKITLRRNKITFDPFYLKNDPVDFYLVGVNMVNSKNISVLNNAISSPFPFNQKQNPSLEQVGVLLSSGNEQIELLGNTVSYLNFWEHTYGSWLGTNNKKVSFTDNTFLNAKYGIHLQFSLKNLFLNRNLIAINDPGAKKRNYVCRVNINAKTFEQKIPIPVALSSWNKSNNVASVLARNQIKGYKCKYVAES